MSENKPNSRTQSGTYLVCINDSEHSMIALKFACQKAAKNGSSVQLIHIIEPADQIFLSVAETMREEREKQAKLLLEKCSEITKEWGEITPIFSVREGFLVEAILQTIDENPDVRMLIIGASHNSVTRGELISALNSEIGNRLLVPILIVPGTLTEQQIREI